VLFQQGTVKYLSAIVLMELQAGAFSAEDQRLLLQLTRAFTAAGHVLRGLQSTQGYNVSTAGSLINDVLIALSARSIGATVVTQNERDFRAIQSVRRFKLELIG
jgi:predicted nucleic acid-binding protein